MRGMGPGPAAARRVLGSSRWRIVGWLMLVVLAVLVVTVVAARQVLLSRLDERLDLELRGELAELRLLAEQGADPVTGNAFPDAESLLLLNLERSIPDRNETMFVVVDGVVVARSADEPPARLDLDPGLVASVDDIDRTVFGSTQTSAGEARWAAVPVTVEDDGSRGVFVVALFADREAADVDEAVRLLLLVSLGTLVIGGALAWFVAGRVLAPLHEVSETARTITHTDLGARIPVPEGASDGDDIAELSRTFNEMLDRLEEAFASQREFVDDAGHELRTPLTVVRGHLETLDPSDPAQVATVRALLLDETERMSRLVADLQTLTKAGRPDFLQRGELDLVLLVDELLVKSSALADRRWGVGRCDDAVVDVDRHRITQAVLQLADNAVRHTGAADRISLGAAADDGTLRIWVDDSGPGIPVEDRSLVLRRFAHGPGSAGAGLGLSLVQAIAVAHGGRVEIGDSPLGGARIALVIPGCATLAPADDDSEVVVS